MSQATIVIPNTGTLSGLSLVNKTNDALAAIASGFSGAAAPSSPVDYQRWYDETANLRRYYDPSAAAWIAEGSFANDRWTPFSSGYSQVALAGGSSSTNHYTVTPAPAITAYVVGESYRFFANHTNTGAADLNISGVGAADVMKYTAAGGKVAVAAGDIRADMPVVVLYDSAGDFILLNPAGSAAGGTYNVGDIFWTSRSAAPSGSLLCFGQNVSRSTYSALNTQYSGQSYPFGSGDGSTTFGIPDGRGRLAAGKDDMGGSAANRLTTPVAGSTMGAAGGTQTVSHSHSFSDVSTGPSANQVTQGNGGSPVSAPAVGHTHTVSGTTGSQAPSVVQPTIVFNMCVYTGV